MRHAEPDLWQNLRAEIVAARPWVDRGVLLAYAALTGLVVVGFTELAEAAFRGFEAVRHFGRWGPWLTLAWSPAVTALLLVWMTRYAPGTAGSGIPQVMRALDDDLAPAQRAWLVSPRLTLHKVMLVSGGLLAGLSIGREGPAAQVGAGVMGHAKRWLSERAGIDEHDLMVAGAAAGIAAAFNTPLGGVMFALEKLSRRRGISHSSIVIACIVLSGLVAVSAFGNETYFGRLRVQQLGWALWWPGLLIALACGVAGGVFARLLIDAARMLPPGIARWRGAHPVAFAAVCAFAVALIGLVTDGATGGGGYGPTRALLGGEAQLPGVYTLLKFCASWLSSWSGVPAGVFAPSLAIGAGIGRDVALLAGVGHDAAIPLIALGMVGFLSAATQGPITAFIIVMEMVSGQTMVLSLMACSLLAGGVSRLLTRPLYSELATLLPLPPLPTAPAPAPDAQKSAVSPG